MPRDRAQKCAISGLWSGGGPRARVCSSGHIIVVYCTTPASECAAKTPCMSSRLPARRPTDWPAAGRARVASVSLWPGGHRLSRARHLPPSKAAPNPRSLILQDPLPKYFATSGRHSAYLSQTADSCLPSAAEKAATRRTAPPTRRPRLTKATAEPAAAAAGTQRFRSTSKRARQRRRHQFLMPSGPGARMQIEQRRRMSRK